MGDINIKLGNATVLDFLERPKEIALGNSNYFSIERSETKNSLSIQSSGMASSNLHVHTVYHRFSFKVNSTYNGVHDDIIYIRWKSKETRPISAYKPLKPQKIEKVVDLGKIALITIDNISEDVSRGILIIDFKLNNKSKEKLLDSDLKLEITRQEKVIAKPLIVFKSQEVEPGKICDGRIIIKINENKPFSMKFALKGLSKKIIIQSQNSK